MKRCGFVFARDAANPKQCNTPMGCTVGRQMEPIFNVTTFKVGGIRFVKLGRITLSFCVSRPRDLPINR
jgi:hypothetical protein